MAIAQSLLRYSQNQDSLNLIGGLNIDSLFTNIPFEKIMEIRTNELFKNNGFAYGSKKSRNSHQRWSMQKGVLRSFTKLPCNFIKKRLWHSCFPVNSVKFLRVPFLQNKSGGCFQKSEFKDPESLATEEPHFMLNNILFKQTEGVAYSFVAYHKRNWLDRCLLE